MDLFWKRPVFIPFRIFRNVSIFFFIPKETQHKHVFFFFLISLFEGLLLQHETPLLVHSVFIFVIFHFICFFFLWIETQYTFAVAKTTSMTVLWENAIEYMEKLNTKYFFSFFQYVCIWKLRRWFAGKCMRRRGKKKFLFFFILLPSLVIKPKINRIIEPTKFFFLWTKQNQPTKKKRIFSSLEMISPTEVIWKFSISLLLLFYYWDSY